MKKNKIDFTVFRRLKLKPFFSLPLLLAFRLAFSPAVKAQQTGGASGEEEDFIKPSRPTVAMPAEIQKAGVL